MPSLEAVEVLLVQCNLVHNQYQRNPEVLYTFMSDKSYVHLLNIEPSNLVFLIILTNNTEFGEIIAFTNQNGGPLEIKDKVKLTLLINK